MTQNFYYNFLEYLSQKEKVTLFGYLQKRKVRIHGFRAIKNVPIKLLASYFEKNEKLLFEILKANYFPQYKNEEDAINNFSSDSAVECFTYLILKENLDEFKLISLMERKIDDRPLNNKVELDKKSNKKSDEFRKKYLVKYKELEQAKEKIEDFTKENKRLQAELETNTKKAVLLEEKIQCKEKQYKEILFNLQQRIDELEKECNRLKRVTYMQNRKILVISNFIQESFDGVTVLSYDNILNLNQIASNYSEILYVPNDMSFSSKRYIQKLDCVKEKLHLFGTHIELVKYLESGR